LKRRKEPQNIAEWPLNFETDIANREHMSTKLEFLERAEKTETFSRARTFLKVDIRDICEGGERRKEGGGGVGFIYCGRD
jgi:hypothetical protein